MALFTVKIGLSSFYVLKTLQNSSGMTTYRYEIYANPGDQIQTSIIGDYENATTEIGGITGSYVDQTFTYSEVIIIEFSVFSPGTPGETNSATITVKDLSINDPNYNLYQDTVSRAG